MYEVYINGQLEKVYKYKIQAWIYLHMKGYIYYGHGWLFKDKNCEIRHLERDR